MGHRGPKSHRSADIYGDGWGGKQGDEQRTISEKNIGATARQADALSFTGNKAVRVFSLFLGRCQIKFGPGCPFSIARHRSNSPQKEPVG